MNGTPPLSRASSAFAISASVACVFNTLLAWAKDAYAPLNKLLASLMGHHWITHGVADCVVFFGLGMILMQTGAVEKVNPQKVLSILIWSVVAASVGLMVWFLLF